MQETSSQQLNNSNNYATLDMVVRSAMATLGMDSMHNYKQFLHFAIEGYQDFHFDQASEIKHTELDVTNWKSVKLPTDFVDVVRLGVRRGDHVIPFDKNSDISLYFDKDECGNPMAHSDYVCSKSIPSADIGVNFGYPSSTDHYFHNLINESGEHEGRMYGRGGGAYKNGSWKINRERGEIQLSSSVSESKIYLEYLANGFDPNEETMVNQYAKKLIKLYIIWQYHEYNHEPRINRSASRHEDLYYAERNKVAGRLNGLSVDEILRTIRDSYIQSPKT